MSEITNNKRKRTARASQLQLTKMIDFFNLNKGLAEGKFNALHGKEEAQKKWAELAAELNTFQGATKTVDQWQVVWRDLKSRVSIKVKELRKAKALTGNKPITQSELSDFELRVLGIVGAEYVEGHKDCPESIPDEENLLEELEHGNISILSETPNVITVCPSTPEKICVDTPNVYVNLLDDDDDSIINDKTINTPYPPIVSKPTVLSKRSSETISKATSRFNFLSDNDDDLIIDDKSPQYTRRENKDSEAIDNNNVIDNCKSRKNSKISISSLKTKSPYSSIASKPMVLKRFPETTRKATLSRKSNRVTSHELHSSKEFFQTIAEKQADAELMHAEAAKVQATASEMHAHAMTEIAQAVQKLADTAAVQADNEKERIQIFEKLVTLLSPSLPANNE